MRKSGTIIFSAFLCGILLYTTWTACSIAFYAPKLINKTYDCAIILGAATKVGIPSPVFEARIKHGIDLYRDGIVRKLIFTGGFNNDKGKGEEEKISESQAAKTYALKAGIAASDIFIEKNSRTTLQNIKEAKRLMSENSLDSAVIVSDKYHLRRAQKMASSLDINSFASATPYSRHKTWKSKIPFLSREIYFLTHFRLFHQ